MVTEDVVINENCSLSYSDSRHLMRISFEDTLEEPSFGNEAKSFIRDCFGPIPKSKKWKGMSKISKRLAINLNSFFLDYGEAFHVVEVLDHPDYYTIERSS